MTRMAVALLATLVLLVACFGTGNDPWTYDPDPDSDSPEALLTEEYQLIANIDGDLRLFSTASPDEYTVIATNLETTGIVTNAAVTPDLSRVAYNDSLSDELTLIEIASSSILKTVGQTCEFFFADDDNLVYSISGDLYRHQIAAATTSPLFNKSGLPLGCDHYPSLSPDGSRFVFKNQPGSDATYWVCDYPIDGVLQVPQGPLYAVDQVWLSDDLSVHWLSDSVIIMKPEPGASYTADEFVIIDVDSFDGEAGGGESVVDAALQLRDDGGAFVPFTKIVVSPDQQKMLLYGSDGLYYLDLTTTDLTDPASLTDGSTVTVTAVFYREVGEADFDVSYASFTPDSRYFVVATEYWIGIYDAVTLQKMSFDSSKIVTSLDGIEYESVFFVDIVG